MSDLKLNVGVGGKPIEGYIGLDKYPGKFVDVVYDLERLNLKSEQLPFPSNTFEAINCEHTLEHVGNVVDVMNEFYRILKPTGRLTVVVPSARSYAAFASPNHKSFFVPETFRDYFASDQVQEKIESDLQIHLIKPWHIEKLEHTIVKMENAFDIPQEIVCVMKPLK